MNFDKQLSIPLVISLHVIAFQTVWLLFANVASPDKVGSNPILEIVNKIVNTVA